VCVVELFKEKRLICTIDHQRDEHSLREEWIESMATLFLWSSSKKGLASGHYVGLLLAIQDALIT